MQRLQFRVVLLEADRPEIKTQAGQQAYERFEKESAELLKQAMNAARKAFRQAAPTRTRKLQKSLRVSQIRRKRVFGFRVIVGFQVSTGASKKLFYGTITNDRKRTAVSKWFDDALEQIIESREFENLQREILQLYSEAIDIEFRGRVRDEAVSAIKAGLPKTRILKDGIDGFVATTIIGRG